MKRSHILSIAVIIIALIIISCIAVPFIFMGKPDPLFSMKNKDTISHQVMVEILDFKNNPHGYCYSFPSPREIAKNEESDISLGVIAV